MKYHWIAAAALIVCSCSVEEISDSLANNGYPSEVTARIDDYTATPETRAYVDENMKILWNQDDRISLFNKYTYNKEYLFKGSDGANSGVFKEVTTNDVVVGNPLDKVYAVYPYMELTEVSNSGVITLELPSEQTYKKNSFGRGDNVMVSATTNTDLVFRNLCGYLVLKLYGDNVSVESISLRGNNGEILAGKADVTADVGSTPTMAFRAAGVSNTITLNCEPPVKLGSSSNDATIFWIVVPPTKFSGGFTLTVTDPEGNVFVKESLSEKEIVWNSTYRVSALKVVPEYTGNIAVKSISLNKTSLSMVEGQSETLVATVAPENATDKAISWTSSDQSIVAVDEDGTLNALSPGTTIITAQAGLKKATCKVTVNEAKNNVIYYTSVDRFVVRPSDYRLFGANILSNEYKNGQGIMVFDGDITEIGSYAFRGSTYLSSVILPNSVTSIGGGAFLGCTGLTSITIPDSVTSIGNFAFDGCTGLTSITIPDSVTSIGGSAFNGCTGLTSVTIPDSVTNIGGSAFQGCTGLTSITIPDSVTSIGNGAFLGCTGLTSITIPDSVTSIGGSAFSDCTGLTSITIPDSVTSIEGYAFRGCTGLTSITIPDSVTNIGSNAFQGCTGLTSITIPDSVTSIGNGAFLGCTGLTSITIPDSVTSIGGSAFNGCTGLTSATIPTCVISNPFANVFGNCENLTSVVINRGVTSIGSNAFNGCTGLTSITIPDSVTSIGEYAFQRCTGLTSITIPNSVTSIGSNAFNGCTGLTSITFPDSVKSIGDFAFWGCTGLTSITIPDGVRSIGRSAFSRCSGLTSVTIPGSVTHIGSDAFYGCTGLTTFTVLASYPPTISSSYSGPLGDSIADNLTIYVLEESVELYKTDPGWSWYSSNIQAIPE